MGRRGTNGVGRAGGTVHYDVPVVDIGFVNEADFDAGWWVAENLCQLLRFG